MIMQMPWDATAGKRLRGADTKSNAALSTLRLNQVLAVDAAAA